MKKVRKKHKSCRVDSLMVHATAQKVTGVFSPEYLADIVSMNPQGVRRILSRASYFISDGENFRKRLRLSSLYKGALMGYENGGMVEVTYSDIEKEDVVIPEPTLGLCMKAAQKYGDCLSLIGLANQLAVYEGHCTLHAIKNRLNIDDSVQSKIVDLVATDFLIMKDVDGEMRYNLTAKAGDIYGILFNTKACA